MRLSYSLELPKQPDKVQNELAIAPEASYTLSIKNPEKGQPTSAGLRDSAKADCPEKLQEEFRGTLFLRVKTLDCSTTRERSSYWSAHAPIRKPGIMSNSMRKANPIEAPKSCADCE